jgi:hypothetical protein
VIARGSTELQYHFEGPIQAVKTPPGAGKALKRLIVVALHQRRSWANLRDGTTPFKTALAFAVVATSPRQQ